MLQGRKIIYLKSVAFGFFVLAAAPLLLSSLFLFRQQATRHKIKEQLETGILHSLSLPEKDIIWVRKNKEIRIGNDLFDVKSIIKHNDSVLVTGLFDHEETELEQMLGQLSGNSNNNSHLLTQLFSFLQHIYPGAGKIELSSIHIREEKVFYIPLLLPELPHSVLTPPPR